MSDDQLLSNHRLEGMITKVAWHPAGNTLAIALQGEKSKTSIFNINTKQRIELDSIADFGARALSWNHNGTRLAVGDYNGHITLFDAAGKRIKTVVTDQKSIVGLDWHPTRDIVVVVGDRISIYDVQSDALDAIEDRAENVLMLCVAWHPSGEFFVTGDYGDFEYHHPPLLQYWAADGQKIKTITESKAEFRNLAWSPDGTLLATASEQVRLWDIHGNLVAERPSPSLLWGIAWNKDGSQLVTTDKNGTIAVWNKRLKKLRELEY